jgi:hypothetical protein
MRIYPNRNPSPRRRAIEASVVLLFGTPMELYFVYYLINAWRTGVVKGLPRGASHVVRYDVEPGWFILNMSFRTLGSLLFAYGLFLGWQELRKALRRSGE